MDIHRQNRRTPLAEGFGAWCIAIADGTRLVMMDFGFAGFLDKFESRFGAKATTLLLFLIGIAVGTFCLNILFTTAILPIIKTILDIINQQAVTLSALLDLLYNFGWLFLLVVVATNIRNLFDIRREMRNAREAADMASEHLQKVESVHDTYQVATDDYFRKARALRTAHLAVLDERVKFSQIVGGHINVMLEITRMTKNKKLQSVAIAGAKVSSETLSELLKLEADIKGVFPEHQKLSPPEELPRTTG